MSQPLKHRLLGLAFIAGGLLLLAIVVVPVLVSVSQGAEQISFVRSETKLALAGPILIVAGLALLVTGDAMSRETPTGKRDHTTAAIFGVFGLGIAASFSAAYAMDGWMGARGYSHSNASFIKVTAFDPASVDRDVAAMEAHTKAASDKIDSSLASIDARAKAAKDQADRSIAAIIAKADQDRRDHHP